MPDFLAQLRQPSGFNQYRRSCKLDGIGVLTGDIFARIIGIGSLGVEPICTIRCIHADEPLLPMAAVELDIAPPSRSQQRYRDCTGLISA